MRVTMPEALDLNEPDGLSDDLDAKKLEKRVVRQPRVVPQELDRRVSRGKVVKKKFENDGTVLSSNGWTTETQLRREKVRRWMMDGHMFDGQIMSVHELAPQLGVPIQTIEHDIAKLKDQMKEFYASESEREIASLAYQVLEMQAQDRGRALSLYNRIVTEIDSEKPIKLKGEDDGETLKFLKSSGRDKAALYTAASTALQQANRSASAMEQLFKLLDGPKKIQNILHAKNVQIVGGGGKGGMFTMEGMQEMLSTIPEMRSLLPSTRHADKLPMPAMLDITPEDEVVMEIGSKARGGR